MRVVQYNILSPKLASPYQFPTVDPENLDPATRLKRIWSKLEGEISNGSVICLQEVPESWIGDLHVLFQSVGYSFTVSSYGTFYTDHMGSSIAYPMNIYLCTKMKITRVGDHTLAPKKKDPSVVDLIINYMLYLWMLLQSIFDKEVRKNYDKEKFDPYAYASGRNNTAIMMELMCKNNDLKYVVSTYHMPCAYFSPPVMALHATAYLSLVQQFAQCDPIIIAVDLNDMPRGGIYKLITGDLDPNDDLHRYSSNFSSMKSAYKQVNGSEPLFTNNAQPRGYPSPFVETLDYIFYHGLSVKAVGDVPTERDKSIYPNEKEPSDHILLWAHF